MLQFYYSHSSVSISLAAATLLLFAHALVTGCALSNVGPVDMRRTSVDLCADRNGDNGEKEKGKHKN